MKEDQDLILTIHNLLTIGSFMLEQTEERIETLKETLSTCEEGKKDSINRCVLYELVEVIDLMVLCEEIDKILSSPLIPQDCILSLNDLKKDIENTINSLKTLEYAFLPYISCPLMENGYALN